MERSKSKMADSCQRSRDDPVPFSGNRKKINSYQDAVNEK